MRTIGSPKFIKVAILENNIEAQLISSILNQRNIPHQIISFYDTAYDGLFQLQKGWGELKAPSRYIQIIRDVIKDVREKPETTENQSS